MEFYRVDGGDLKRVVILTTKDNDFSGP